MKIETNNDANNTNNEEMNSLFRIRTKAQRGTICHFRKQIIFFCRLILFVFKHNYCEHIFLVEFCVDDGKAIVISTQILLNE